jgi:hypothetical protein
VDERRRIQSGPGAALPDRTGQPMQFLIDEFERLVESPGISMPDRLQKRGEKRGG